MCAPEVRGGDAAGNGRPPIFDIAADKRKSEKRESGNLKTPGLRGLGEGVTAGSGAPEVFREGAENSARGPSFVEASTFAKKATADRMAGRGRAPHAIPESG